MCTVKRLRGEKSMSGRFSSARLKAGKSVDPDQKAWSFIRQLNKAAGTKPDRIALEDGARQISYRDMYRHWERYAAVFTSLGMTEKEKALVGLRKCCEPADERGAGAQVPASQKLVCPDLHGDASGGP